MPARLTNKTVCLSPFQGAPERGRDERKPLRPEPDNALEPLTVRISTAVKMIGVGRTKLYQLIASGDIEAVKVGAATLVTMASLKRLVAQGSGR